MRGWFHSHIPTLPTVVAGQDEGQAARRSAQEQGQHDEGAASPGEQRHQQAGHLREAREELGQEHVHIEGTDVQADSVIRQSYRSAAESEEEGLEFLQETPVNKIKRGGQGAGVNEQPRLGTTLTDLNTFLWS